MTAVNKLQTFDKRCPTGTAFALVAILTLGIGFSGDNVFGEDAGKKSYSASLNFISHHLSQQASATTQTLWLTGGIKDRAAEILGHRFSGLRVRYWGENNRTVWVLDEIGKEMPITIGVVVENTQLVDIQILEYRETRGGEVRYPFFTDQFKGLTLDRKNQNKLNGSIDGITGATLSVAAVRKIAILALVFHQHTPYSAR